LTDDLEAAAEVISTRFTIQSSTPRFEVPVSVALRPRLTVHVPDVRDARRVLLASGDAARDITDDVRNEREIPVPASGRVVVALGSGRERRALWLPDLREPGGALVLTFPPAKATAPARAPLATIDVRDGTGKPVEGATVSIDGPDSVRSATTDSSGRV